MKINTIPNKIYLTDIEKREFKTFIEFQKKKILTESK